METLISTAFLWYAVLAIGVIALLLAVNHLLPKLDNMWLDILMRSSIVTAIMVLLILKMNLSSDLRRPMVNLLRKVGIDIR